MKALSIRQPWAWLIVAGWRRDLERRWQGAQAADEAPAAATPDDRLDRLARAVLLFHHSGQWTAEDCETWIALTGQRVATARVLAVCRAGQPRPWCRQGRA